MTADGFPSPGGPTRCACRPLGRRPKPRAGASSASELPGAAEGFAALRAARCAARWQGDARGLTATAGPAFTAGWLAPRLVAFARTRPDIDRHFSAPLQVARFIEWVAAETAPMAGLTRGRTFA